ncbi:hypothetical protein K8I28_10245 [bacterium]|nr:hypothetical protein [bacterium]
MRYSIFISIGFLLIPISTIGQHIDYLSSYFFEDSGGNYNEIDFHGFFFEYHSGMNIYRFENREVERIVNDNENDFGRPAFRDSLVFLGSSHSIGILDISDPYNPISLFRHEHEEEFYSTYPGFYQNYLFICELRSNSMRVYDIEELENPVLVHTVTFEDFEPNYVLFENDILYLGGLDAVKIYRMQAYNDFEFISEFTFTPSIFRWMKITDDLLYIYKGSQFVVLDKSDLQNPLQLTNYHLVIHLAQLRLALNN